MFPADSLPISPKCLRLWNATTLEYRSARDIAVTAGFMQQSDPRTSAPSEVYTLLNDLVERNMLEGRSGTGYRRRPVPREEFESPADGGGGEGSAGI